MRPLRLVQITDCHLGSTPGEEMLGLDTDKSLFEVLQTLQTEPVPDIIVASGDISNDAGPESYKRFVNILDHFFPNVPLAWLPGNHDDPANMDLVDELPIEAHYRTQGWNLIFLDSRIPMEEGGDLSSNELLRLEQELKAHPVPTLVFLHHQPVPVGSEWIDQYVVKNRADFFNIIDQYPHVKSIVWGHVHQEFKSERNGVQLYATPSTCIQFAPNSKDFKLDDTMPGYRSFTLHANGELETDVKRIAQRDYVLDFTATGY